MGLFDRLLKKAAEGISEAVNNGVKESVSDTLKENFNIGDTKECNFTIPSEYDSFPKFEGSLMSGLEKKETKYNRVMLNYETNELNVSKYRELLLENGYKKATDIRYEKDNTYVIVNLKSSSLELVYHIKK